MRTLHDLGQGQETALALLVTRKRRRELADAYRDVTGHLINKPVRRDDLVRTLAVMTGQAPAEVEPATFVDATAHRQELMAVYNRYFRCAGDPAL